MLQVFACCLVSLLAGRVQAQATVSIHDIMTSLPASPLLGQNVTTNGVVLGVIGSASGAGNNGFYISLPTYDSNANTAEGIFIGASPVPACNAVSVGQVATITGIVTNTSAPNLTAANTPGTFLAPTACSVNGAAAMTQAVNLDGNLTGFGDALKYTGTAVSNASFFAVGPTAGTLPPNGSIVISNGQFWATLNANTDNHLFRNAGIAGDEYTPAGAPANIPTWSGNPQRFLIDTTSFGGAPVDVTAGQAITCTNTNTSGQGATRGIGLVDYTLGYARLLIFNTVHCAVGGNPTVTATPATDASHFSVATLDVNTFLGSASIFQTALSKATLAVTSVFGSPDMFAMQEVGGQDTLQYLADAANATNGGATAYTATVLGTDLVNSGFLVNSNTVKNTNYLESGRDATYATAAGSAAALWEHPPLILTGELARAGKNFSVTVINVHMASRDNIDDSVLGPDIRRQRAAQAAAVSALVQQYQSAGGNVVVAGNLNSYEFNDGYVDVLGVVSGSPAAAGSVSLYQPTLTTAALNDFTIQVPATSRYNVIERGNAAALEHILASATLTDSATSPRPLASYATAVTQPHFSADFAATSANDPGTPAGLTPHDGFLVTFLIPPVPTAASLTPASLNFGDVYLGGSNTLAAAVSNTTTISSTVNVSSITISGTDAADFQQTSGCMSLTSGSTCNVNVTFSPSSTGTHAATLTVQTDATSNATFTVPLTGVGLDTSATLTPSSADFGVQLLNTASAAKLFTWTNTSSVPLPIAYVNTSGDYSVAGTTCIGSVAAKSSCTVLVAFTPVALRTRTGMLTVVSASSLNGTLTAALTGVGAAVVDTDTNLLGFGKIDVGARSGVKTVTITNYTAAPLALTSVTLTGDYVRSAATCNGTLQGNSSCTVSILFAPTAVGLRNGSLLVTTDNTRSPGIAIALSGDGVDFSVAVAPASGSVIAGLGVTAAATLTPLGDFDAPVTMGCTTVATGTACAFQNSTLTLSGVATDPLTITTTSQYAVIGYSQVLLQPGHRSLLLTLLGLCSGAALLAGRRRSMVRLVMILVVAAITAGAMSGCSGKLPAANTPYTAPGTYDILVTATDGTVTRSAVYSLKVTAK